MNSPVRTTSSILVNDQEKRVETEIYQLVQDIRRIEPCGEDHCTYGSLFSDPSVEQYYEALLGTLKAAKRKGLINFQGQILLKGMHDNVLVHISEAGASWNGNDEKKEENAAVNMAMNTPVRNTRRMSPNDVKNLISSNRNDGTISGSMHSRNSTSDGSLGSYNNSIDRINHSKTPQCQSKSQSSPLPKAKSRKEIKAAALAMTSAAKRNLNNKKAGEKPNPTITLPSTSASALESEPSKHKSKLTKKLMKDREALALPSNTCADTVATAPVHSVNKAYTKKAFQPKYHKNPQGDAKNVDLFHSATAGTLSPAVASRIPKAESHEERVEREIKQLLLDIRRIEPSNDPHCSFGDLFVDETVEQYYEALVGTLKAAKKKGLIQFKGQMLLKGMHDDVQISIVEE